jgi:hypothetical protein
MAKKPAEGNHKSSERGEPSQQKLPWFPFFATDWLGNTQLRLASMEAGCLLINILALLHVSPRRGYLVQPNGQPWSVKQLAQVLSRDSVLIARLLEELEHLGLLHRDENGAILSQRMVDAEDLRQKRSDAGRKGGRITGDLLKQMPKHTVEANAQARSDSVSENNSQSGIGGWGG